MRNEKQRKKLKIALIAAGLLIIFSVIGYSAQQLINRARISNIQIKVNNLTCTDKDQITQFLKEKEIHYFAFNSSQLTKDLQKKFFCIGKISSDLTYPDKLDLEVWGREALFAVKEVKTSVQINPSIDLPESTSGASESTQEAQSVKTIDEVLKNLNESSGSAVYLIDNEGVIFEQVLGSINFPTISILGLKLQIGGKIPESTIEKVKYVYSRLKEMGAPTDNIVIAGDKLIINSKPRIIFSLKKREDYQTASLQLILSQSKMNSDPNISGKVDIESIDLRFDKPVVVYSKK